MKIHNAYEGKLNGIKGVWTDERPYGVVIEREFIFITADDDDHILKNKETEEEYLSVIIKNESETNNWEEVKRERHHKKGVKNG